MKYEWIEAEAYSNWKNLTKYVEQILRDFGGATGNRVAGRYVINFA